MRVDRWTEAIAREWDEARRERTKIVAAPDYRALTAEEFDQHIRNGTPADYIFVGRLLTTVKLMMQVERASRLLCKYQPGVYSNIQQALGALDAAREV